MVGELLNLFFIVRLNLVKIHRIRTIKDQFKYLLFNILLFFAASLFDPLNDFVLLI